MKTREEMEVAGFRFTMEPAFDSPLTMNEHSKYDEACERWRKAVIHAMIPWNDGSGPQLVAVDGEIVDPSAAGIQVEYQGPPTATGMFFREPE